jgi:DNA-binding response OmpR family regulator
MSILIVEDDPSTLFAYAQRLGRARLDVIEAASGQEALDLLERGVRPSVLVVDLGLPDVQGADLIAYFHGDVALRDIPIVVVTSRDPSQVHVIVDAILFKPFPEAELVSTVHRLHQRAIETAPQRTRQRHATHTTLPDLPAPALRCPTCDTPLRYDRTIFNGAGIVERWDLYSCRTCGPYEYRHRTRKLRLVAT